MDDDPPPPRRPAPFLLPAAGLLAGAALSWSLRPVPVPLPAALAVLAFAWGLGESTGEESPAPRRRRDGSPARRGACLLGWLALGLLLLPLRGPAPGQEARLQPSRPVLAVGKVAGHWRRGEGDWSAPFTLEWWRQGQRVGFAPREVFLILPGEEPPPAAGSRLRVKGHLRRSEGYWNRLPTPPGPWRLRVKSHRLLRLDEKPGAPARLSNRLRQRLEAALPEPPAGGHGSALVRALLLGDSGALPGRWRRGLRRSGLAHLLAVSGLHVGLVVAVVLLGGWALPRPARLALALLAVGFYLAVVGPRPSLLRASVMAVLAVLALLAARPPSSANSLAWAAALLVTHRPAAVADPGFQLTVAATAGLVLLAPVLEGRWRRLPALLRRPLAASAAAQVAVLPWTLPLFHLAAPAAILLNLVAVPWVSLCLALMVGWALLALAAPGVAAAVLPCFDPLAAPLGWMAAARGGVHLALPVAAGPAGATLLAGVSGLLLLRPRLGLVCITPLLVGFCAWPAPPAAPEVTVTMLDVGQGDAFLLRDGRRSLLVDGGGWKRGDFGGMVLLPALAGEGIRALDAVVLTHPDRDHCGGLLDLVDYLPVREVWTPAGLPADGCGGALARLPGVRRRVLWAGEEATLGRWRFLTLHPRAGERIRGNEGSLVLAAEAHGRRVLLTGDIGAPGERRLLRRARERLECDVLKLAHHGSRFSSTPGFLAAASPALALVSAGRHNRYHHPARQTLERLERRGVRLWRSDREGMVQLLIRPDGGIRVRLPGRRPEPAS